MSFCILFLFAVVFLSANGQFTKGNHDIERTELDQKELSSNVTLPTYSVVIIGLLMIVMLAIIVCLVIAYVKKTKPKLRISPRTSKNNARQSTGPILDDMSIYEYGGNVSTLSINSGIIEVNRYSDPPTPQIDNDIKIFNKHPAEVPQMITRKQMDDVILEVLNKLKKRDSISLRDLDRLRNENVENDKSEEEKLTELDIYHEVPARVRCFSRRMTQSEKPKIKRDSFKTQERDEKDKDNTNVSLDDNIKEGNGETVNESKSNYTPENALLRVKAEVTVNGKAEFDVSTEKESVLNNDDTYDSPPTKDAFVILDVDSDYLFPMTSGDTGSYINAKRSPQKN